MWGGHLMVTTTGAGRNFPFGVILIEAPKGFFPKGVFGGGRPLGKLGKFSQGLDPGPAQGLTWANPKLDQASPGQFLVKNLAKQSNRNNSGDGNDKGARAPWLANRCASWFVVGFVVLTVGFGR